MPEVLPGRGASYMTPKEPKATAPKKRVFTDEDLERLKEGLVDPECTLIVDEHEMRAIVSRLEAAERVIALVDARNRNDYWDAHSEWLTLKGNDNGKS
jgi:hypothetical protein